MSTLSDVVTAVSARLLDDSNTAVSTGTVESCINQSIGYWKNKVFYFNEFQDTSLTLTASSATVPTPTAVTMLYPFEKGGLVINYASARFEVYRKPTHVFDSLNFQGTGLPFMYTFRNNAYECYFLPDVAYSIIWRGIKDYSALVSTGSNDWTTIGEPLIRYDALSRLQAELRLDPEMSEYYTNRTQDEYKNLISLTARLKQSGHLEVNSIL